MADGALAHSRAQVSLAVTGIAGPTGGTVEAKPVGTVWFAWCVGGETHSEMQHFAGDRAASSDGDGAVCAEAIAEPAASVTCNSDALPSWQRL